MPRDFLTHYHKIIPLLGPYVYSTVQAKMVSGIFFISRGYLLEVLVCEVDTVSKSVKCANMVNDQVDTVSASFLTV